MKRKVAFAILQGVILLILAAGALIGLMFGTTALVIYAGVIAWICWASQQEWKE